MMHELSAFQVQVFTLLESKTVQFVTYSWVCLSVKSFPRPFSLPSSTQGRFLLFPHAANSVRPRSGQIFVAMGLIFWEPVSSREDVSTDQRTLVSSRRHCVICPVLPCIGHRTNHPLTLLSYPLLDAQVVLEFLFLAWVALLIIGRIAVYRWAFLHKPWNWLLVAVWFLTFVDACSFAAASGNVVRFARPLRAMFILSFAPQLRRMTASILVTLVRCVLPLPCFAIPHSSVHPVLGSLTAPSLSPAQSNALVLLFMECVDLHF